MGVITQADLDSWAAQLETAEAADKAQFDAIIAAIKSGTLPPPSSGSGPVTNPISGFPGLSLGDANVWNQTPNFKEDFPVAVGKGQFGGTYRYWFLYPKGWRDTSGKGVYDPANVSVVDLGNGLQVMRQMVAVASDGTFGGCVACPQFNGDSGVGYAKSMRYTERRRLTQQDNGHDVLLGWPANDGDWAVKSGEPDHVEMDTNNNPTIGGFIHLIGGRSNDDNLSHQIEIKSDVKAYDDFHVVTIEQIAGESYRRYIDNKLYNVILNPGKTATAADKAAYQFVQLQSGWSVPGADPLRVCKQLESNGSKPTKGGVILDTDYVVIQSLK